MAAQSRYCCAATLRGHTNYARRRRPVEPKRRSLVDATTGAGLVRRRPVERPRRVRVVGRHAQGLGRLERQVPPDAERAHEHSAAPASSRHNASIARRRREGRRSIALPRCRTAPSCPGRPTARSRCGKMSRGRWHVCLPCTGLRRISPDVSSPRSSRTVGLFRFRVASARDVIYWCSLSGLYEWERGLPRIGLVRVGARPSS